MRIYISNLQDSLNKIGGGFRFIQNLYKGLKNKVEFVNNWKDSDIVFIFGITTINKSEIHEAINNGKKSVLRVDNIPKRSRNRRQSPVDRLQEFGNKADAVIYQSKWCKEYAGFFIDNENEYIINNGVDTSIFNINNKNSDGNTYLYINYNDNPNKRFYEALYWFDIEWRINNKAHLIIAGQAPSIYIEHPEYNWDLTVNGKVEYKGIYKTDKSVAKLMKQCDFLLYPSFAEAYPNTVLEAMACGLEPLYISKIGGTQELIDNNNLYIKTLEEMCDEYYNLFISII